MSSLVSNEIYVFIKSSGGYNWNKNFSQNALISREDQEDGITKTHQLYICKDVILMV